MEIPAPEPLYTYSDSAAFDSFPVKELLSPLKSALVLP